MKKLAFTGLALMIAYEAITGTFESTMRLVMSMVQIFLLCILVIVVLGAILNERMKNSSVEDKTKVKAFPDGRTHLRFDSKPDKPSMSLYPGSSEKTRVLRELLRVPLPDRGGQWVRALFNNVVDARLCGDFERPITGPDGFPYFRLSSSEPNEPSQAKVIRYILPYLLEHGYGVALDPDKGDPDWVFSYGDIVNCAVYGALDARDDQFEADDDDVLSSELAKGRTGRVGTPSSQLLPPPVRTNLRRFLEAHGFSPRIMLMDRKPDPQSGRKGGLSLVFPIPQMIEPNSEMAQYVFRAVSWFLPRHYTVAWMREDEKFVEL